MQHRVKIQRFQNKKPTVVDEYTKRVRQAQAGGGANARAYALRTEELDEVKNLKTQLRAMEVKEALGKQVLRKQQLTAEEAEREAEYERRARLEHELATRVAIKAEKEYHNRCVEHQRELAIQRARASKIKILEEERKEQENRSVRLQLEAAQREEEKKLLVAREAQRTNARELKEANVRAQNYRRREQEAMKQEEIDIIYYHRRKELEASLREKEILEYTTMREKEITRLRELQEKSNDKQAEEDTKRAIAYREQMVEKRDKREAAQKDATAQMLRDVMAVRATQVKHREKSIRQAKLVEEQESRRLQREYQLVKEAEVQKELAYAEEKRAHWKKVDKLKELRIQEKANEAQEILNRDQRFAMNKAVYDHEVAVAYNRKLDAHRAAGRPLPKQFQDGAADLRTKKAADRKKAQMTRPLW